MEVKPPASTLGVWSVGDWKPITVTRLYSRWLIWPIRLFLPQITPGARARTGSPPVWNITPMSVWLISSLQILRILCKTTIYGWAPQFRDHTQMFKYLLCYIDQLLRISDTGMGHQCHDFQRLRYQRWLPRQHHWCKWHQADLQRDCK